MQRVRILNKSKEEMTQHSGAEKRQVTFLSVSIIKFTDFLSKPSRVVASRLSAFIAVMTDLIAQQHGIVIANSGDSLKAFFDIAGDIKKSARNACLSAVNMLNRFTELQHRWGADEEPQFKLSVGLHSDTALVGSFGHAEKQRHLAVSQAAMFVDFIRKANDIYQTSILSSEETIEHVKSSAIFRNIDKVCMGEDKVIDLFELMDIAAKPNLDQTFIISSYSEGLKYYQDKKWGQAIKAFRRVLRHFPDDGPSKLLTIRCLDFLEHPPEYTWDGVVNMNELLAD